MTGVVLDAQHVLGSHPQALMELTVDEVATERAFSDLPKLLVAGLAHRLGKHGVIAVEVLGDGIRREP
jgi:hypothetical protein